MLRLLGTPERRGDRRLRSGFGAGVLRLVDVVLAKVAAKHGLAADFVRFSRSKIATRARREWICLIQDSWALSSTDTGRICGVDHASVLLAQKHRAKERERELAA